MINVYPASVLFCIEYPIPKLTACFLVVINRTPIKGLQYNPPFFACLGASFVLNLYPILNAIKGDIGPFKAYPLTSANTGMLTVE